MNEHVEETIEVVDLDEIEVEPTRWERFKGWCSDHAQMIVDLTVAAATMTAACITAVATKNSTNDALYTEVDDEIYRIPVRKMKTTKKEKEFVKKSI